MRGPTPRSEMRWFVVISARDASGKQIVEILDGPFWDREAAVIAASRHLDDGETGAYARKRYVPKKQTWQPIFDPA